MKAHRRNNKILKKRWVILRGSSLSYYTSKDDSCGPDGSFRPSTAKRSLELTAATVIESELAALQLTVVSILEINKTNKAKEDRLVFMCEEEKQFKAWLFALRTNIRVCRNSNQNGRSPTKTQRLEIDNIVSKEAAALLQQVFNQEAVY